MIVLVFPGQGSQKVGMLSAFVNAFKSGRDVLDEIENSVSFRISKVIEEGSLEELTKTNNAQLAIFTVGMVCLGVLAKEYGFDIAKHCKYLAGHSLGEYTALCASGVFALADATRLVKARGDIMAQVCNNSADFSMVALLGVPIFDIEPIIQEFQQGPYICSVANDNMSSQVVISGYRSVVNQAIDTIKYKFNKLRTIPLNTSGPFHTSLMSHAAIALDEFLISSDIKYSDFKVPVISNVSAFPINNKDQVHDELIRQMVSKVRWRETTDILVHDNEIDMIVEVAPGKVLTSMIRRDFPNTKVFSLETVNQIEEFIKLN